MVQCDVAHKKSYNIDMENEIIGEFKIENPRFIVKIFLNSRKHKEICFEMAKFTPYDIYKFVL